MKNNIEEKAVDSTKREFMKKFGGYAATAPIGMYMLMTPNASAYCVSGTNRTPDRSRDVCKPNGTRRHIDVYKQDDGSKIKVIKVTKADGTTFTKVKHVY